MSTMSVRLAVHTGTGCFDASGPGPGAAGDGRAGQRQVLCGARRHPRPAQQRSPLHLCSSGTEVQTCLLPLDFTLPTLYPQQCSRRWQHLDPTASVERRHLHLDAGSTDVCPHVRAAQQRWRRQWRCCGARRP